MPDTEFLVGAVETVKRWAGKLIIELPREIYFGKFMKEDMNSIIEVKRDLEGKPGDVITFTLLRKLAGAGVTGDSTLEGSEEALSFYSDTVTLDQVRNAVRLTGRLSERRTAFDQRVAAKNVLKTWLAENIDDDVFTQLDVSPAASRTIYGGNATSTATIGSDDTIDLQDIDRLVGIASKATPKLWPVRINNDNHYVLLLHTDVLYDLRQTTAQGGWQLFQQQAGPRDYDKNPIFAGGAGMYNGVIIHAHEKIPTTTGWGSDALQPGASNYFLARQAGVFAWGSKPEWWEKEFDYGNKVGFAIGAIWDFTKAVYNAVDHGFIAVRTYRTNLGA